MDTEIFVTALAANIVGQMLGTSIVLFSYKLIRDLRRRWQEAQQHT